MNVKVLILLFATFAATKTFSQIGVSADNTPPHGSAMLEVKSPNKGFLPPRVSLNNVTDIETIEGPATGLLVYNTNAAMVNGVGKGYYYFNGSKWVYIGLDSYNLLLGKWNIVLEERENYYGGIMSEKKLSQFVGSNTSTTYNAGDTYSSLYFGSSAGGGTWQLLSPKYLVLDKNHPTEERYYHILILDNENLVTRGPFKANGTPRNNFLYTFYYKK